VGNTGTDPFELQKQSAQQAAQAGKGTTGKTAVRGAAAGALIGGIADDEWGKGAAIGAGVGMLAGNARSRRKDQAAVAQVDAQAQQEVQAPSTRQVDAG
jgi:hypothetical protein